MANLATLKAQIDAQIKTNGTQSITGAILNNILNNIVTTLGNGYAYKGVATAATDPSTPDNPVYYLAYAAGTYTNFNSVVLDGSTLHILTYDTAWTDTDLGIATSSALTTALAAKADAATTLAGYGITDAMTATEIQSELSDIDTTLSNKADIDGYYTSMVVGAAENLVDPDGTPTAREFTYSSAGGTADIGSGTAVVDTIKGKSLIWNQLLGNVTGSSGTGITWTLNEDGSISANGTAEGLCYVQYYADNSSTGFKGIVGHKYLVYFTDSYDSTAYGIFINNGGFSGNINSNGIITCTDGTLGSGVILRITSGTTVTNKKFYPMLIDLTLMGIASSVTSVADFRALYPNAYYAYNAGTPLHFTATSLIASGTNLYNPSTATARLPYVASATGFKIQGTYTSVSFTPAGSSDAEEITPDSNGQFSTSVEGTLSVTGGNSTDTMVYIYWSHEDKDFVAYKESTLDISWIYALEDGNGNKPFADGVKSAGSVYDDPLGGYCNIGVMDLGTLGWAYDNDLQFFYKENPFPVNVENRNTVLPSICSKYMNAGVIANSGDEEFANAGDKIFTIHSRGTTQTTFLYIKDTAYSDAATFKAAMSGVYLYYELATPVAVTLPSSINTSIAIDDWGVEGIAPTNGSTPASAPASIDIIYGLNAVDTIKNLPRNYISADAFDAFNAALTTAFASIGYTYSCTRSYSEETKEQSFTISLAATESNE